MSIKLLNIHQHEICFSYITNTMNIYNYINNYKYEMNGWYNLNKNGSFMLNKNDYIELHCNTCLYSYNSLKNIKTYTTNNKHNLFLGEFGAKNLYTTDNKIIQVDGNINFYLADYFLINNEYGDIIYIGTEKEIRDYLFSEMKNFEKLYNQERIRNNNLNYFNERKKEKVMELNRENDDFKKMKDELQIENAKLKEENTLLQNAVTNYSNKEGDYDIILCADSIKNLTSIGWKIKYNKKEGKKVYEDSKNKETIVVGVVGNGNKGKSFLLKKLSNYNVPMGYNVKTEGLSIIYGKTEKKNLAILDSAGQETPLLIQKKDDNNNININNNNINNNINNNSKEIKIYNKDEFEFEEYSRDKLVTELYIQKFILWKSNIVILLVGSITLSEQKLYARVKSEILALQENQKETKKLFVVHNLQNLYHKEDVDDYIENVLKKLYNVNLQEISMYDVDNKITGFDKYFLEKDNKNIIHLIFINDYCKYSNYYNKNTISYLNGAIKQEPSRQTFEILENSKEFLLEISEEIMENKLKPNDIDIILDKETQTEKLIIKNHKEIQLKKFIVDEMGVTKNDANSAKYSYYIDAERSKFIVNFELPGGGSFDPPIVTPIQGYYFFKFEGEQNGELSPNYTDSEQEEKVDQKYEELSKEQLDKILLSKNLRKRHPIHIDFKISNQVIQMRYDFNNLPEYTWEITKNGIVIFIFKINLVNNSSEKKHQEEIIKF